MILVVLSSSFRNLPVSSIDSDIMGTNVYNYVMANNNAEALSLFFFVLVPLWDSGGLLPPKTELVNTLLLQLTIINL